VLFYGAVVGRLFDQENAMHNHHRNQISTSGTGAVRLLVNGFLMLALLVSSFGVAMASSS